MNEYLAPFFDALSSVTPWLAAHEILWATALAAAAGSSGGALAVFSVEKHKLQKDIESIANVTIASYIALLGKIVNFKKDFVIPESHRVIDLVDFLTNPETPAQDKKSAPLKLDLWPEISFSLILPETRIHEYSSKALDVIQLTKMLEYNLSEMTYLIEKRNGLIKQLRAENRVRNSLPLDMLKLYVSHIDLIARNVDESLFYLDRAMEKTRAGACNVLPFRQHKNIAAVSLSPEAKSLMPQKDLIKGWVA